MTKRRVVVALVLMVAAVAQGQLAQRHAERVAESGHVQSARGGATFEVSGAYDKVFDSLVRYLKLNGYTVESASRDAGEIATALEITGGYHQSGKRTTISVIKDTADKTSIRVAITIQKRFKAIQTEPWGDPKVDDKGSADLASKMQPEINASLAQQN